MKLAILKPVMWNDKGYQHPAGCLSTSGYSKDYGYGHEEWNGNPKWKWKGLRIFHTETQPKLDKAAENGDLGMVMIAAHEGKAYAVGVATNVFVNSENVSARIAEDLKIFGKAQNVWSVQAVQEAFHHDQARFEAHWRDHYQWIHWRCPQEQYYWFSKPILLDPRRITGKSRLAMHHGKYTFTTPAVLLDIIDKHLPKTHMAIRDWLSFGDFSHREDCKSKSQAEGTKKRLRIQKRRNAPPSPLPTPPASDLEDTPADRVESTIYRILRDTELALRVKVDHEYKCQICGHRIQMPDGSYYAEAHHIQPLGKPHNGPDVIGNIICVCPNHHAELDYFVRPLNLTSLKIAAGHIIDQKFVDYHNITHTTKRHK